MDEVNICPVCGYAGLDDPPWDPITNLTNFDICPACGCEFGYEDATTIARENYRLRWIKSGAQWFDVDRKPKDWDLKAQLSNIDVNLDDFGIDNRDS